MVAAGHSWPSIQNYTFSEIGLFLKVIVRNEIRDKIENLNFQWGANNFNNKQLKQVVNDLSKYLEDKKPMDTPEDFEVVKSEWNRLAAFMGGANNGRR